MDRLNTEGVIHLGLGQTWWTAAGLNSSVIRPILFGTDGLKQGSISGLTFKNPPNWFNLIANSTEVLITDLNLTVVTTNAKYPAKVTLYTKQPQSLENQKRRGCHLEDGNGQAHIFL
jgi:hypothetical protein